MKVRDFLVEFWNQLVQDDVLSLAAQCAYYFSFFPVSFSHFYHESSGIFADHRA